jgi:UDP-glucose:(heptosyl)LPS alpha-1,3-glucosyltransferase
MTPSALRALAGVIERERPDIVHSYRDRSNLWTRVAMAAHGVRVPVVIVSVRNRNLDPLNLLAEEHLIDRTDRVLANSEGIRRELVGRARVPADRIEVIPNFIDTTRFRAPTADERQRARARWELGDELALLLPGRVTPQKHQAGLMFALWKLRRERRLPANVRVLLAGRLRGAVYTRVVRAQVKLFGLEGCVRFLGPVTEMPSLYHAADGLLLPSLYEGMPNAVIEGQVSGLPAVVSAAANADALVVDGEGGFEVPTADSDALAEAIARICELSGEERREMGARGRERVRRMLDQDAILARIVALYDHLLEHK